MPRTLLAWWRGPGRAGSGLVGQHQPGRRRIVGIELAVGQLQARRRRPRPRSRPWAARRRWPARGRTWPPPARHPRRCGPRDIGWACPVSGSSGASASQASHCSSVQSSGSSGGSSSATGTGPGYDARYRSPLRDDVLGEALDPVDLAGQVGVGPGVEVPGHRDEVGDAGVGQAPVAVQVPGVAGPSRTSRTAGPRGRTPCGSRRASSGSRASSSIVWRSLIQPSLRAARRRAMSDTPPTQDRHGRGGRRQHLERRRSRSARRGARRPRRSRACGAPRSSRRPACPACRTACPSPRTPPPSSPCRCPGSPGCRTAPPPCRPAWPRGSGCGRGGCTRS